jgi:hypothetical protein
MRLSTRVHLFCREEGVAMACASATVFQTTPICSRAAYRVAIISQPICAKRLVIPAISVPLGFVRAD